MVGKDSVDRARGSAPALGSILRPLGRAAIWVVLAILLLRGLGAVLSPGREAPPEAGARSEAPDPASAALAVRFARAYLVEPTQRALGPMLAEGARIVSGREPAGSRAGVAQAEVVAARRSGGREVLTVACELHGGRHVHLAVPLVRSSAGEVAVASAPWFVAAPSAEVELSQRPRPISGPQAGAIAGLVARFLPAYLSGAAEGDLSYLLAPGARVAPLEAGFEPVGRPGAPRQLGEEEGRRRTIAVAVRLRDRRSGAVYPLDYVLRIERRERWYVRAVEGSPR